MSTIDTVSSNGSRAATAPRAPLLEADKVCSGYDGIPVLKDLSLAVFPGEVVALLGANGAGKSTTLLTMAGELPVQSGQVRWLGAKARGPLHARARSGLAFLPAERSLFMSLTVRQNLRLGRGPAERAYELMPELRKLVSRPAGLLSGGEQQMLTLARALAGDFKVLMLDEISLGLAPIIVRRLLEVIRIAASEQQVGILLVEQHVSAALAFSDRAVVLRRGEVVLEGESQALRQDLEKIAKAYL